jgi:hypothetical protein
MKRFLIPPLAPALMVLALCIWTIWDETSNSPPRIINGAPDDAPRYAALFLAFLTPLFYVGFGVFNLIDSLSDRFQNPLPWLASGVMTMVIAMLLTKIFYIPNVDTSQSTGIAMACVIAVMAVWPMCLLRRLVFARANAGCK